MLHWKGKSKTTLEHQEFSLSEVYSPLFEEEGKKGETPLIKSITSKKPCIPHFQTSLKDNFDTHNLLIQGNNLHALQVLRETMKNSVDLIYIDPPFMKNVSFYRQVYLRGIEEDISYKQKQYSDTWNLETYLQFLYERFHILKELLSETGSIYVHLDEDAAHYIKVILDEVFGRENFRRQIIWNTASLNVAGFKGQVRDNYIYATGIVLFYSKSDIYTFHSQFNPHPQEFIDKKYKKSDENGKFRITRRDNKIYLHEDPGEPIINIWNDILSFNYAKIASRESVFYPTQKPEALLERIIKTSSNSGDVVLDCFSGSGTTAAVAQKLNRRWIACDSNRNAIQTCSKRLQRVINSVEYSQKSRSFQIWYEDERSIIHESIKFLGERNGKKISITFLNFNENLVFENAKETQKKQVHEKTALIDSILFSFSVDPNPSSPYLVQYSDIPRGRKEAIKGIYEFNLPSWMEEVVFVHIRVSDIFGNCYSQVLNFNDLTDSDSD